VSAWDEFWAGVGQAVADTAQAAGEAVEEAVEAIVEAASEAVEAAQSMVEKAVDTVTGGVAEAAEPAGDAMSYGYSAIAGGADSDRYVFKGAANGDDERSFVGSCPRSVARSTRESASRSGRPCTRWECSGRRVIMRGPASTAAPRWLVGGVLLVLAGSLAGFLWHNRPPAKIFMGDSGSYFIGLLLASMTVLGTFYEYDEMAERKHVILAPLCILAVPLYDFTSVMVIRLAQGRSPFHPDKSHFSHRLVERGLRPGHAVLTIHLATLTTGLGALLLYQVPGWTGAGLVIGLIACVLAIVAILETAGRAAGATVENQESRHAE
jgi:hypothetical protein